MLAKNAVQKPERVKPSTSDETNISTKALMTNKNSPKVKTVRGSVSKIKIGFTTAFANPSSSAEIAKAEAV